MSLPAKKGKSKSKAKKGKKSVVEEPEVVPYTFVDGLGTDPGEWQNYAEIKETWLAGGGIRGFRKSIRPNHGINTENAGVYHLVVKVPGTRGIGPDRLFFRVNKGGKEMEVLQVGGHAYVGAHLEYNDDYSAYDDDTYDESQSSLFLRENGVFSGYRDYTHHIDLKQPILGYAGDYNINNNLDSALITASALVLGLITVCLIILMSFLCGAFCYGIANHFMVKNQNEERSKVDYQQIKLSDV